MPKKTTAKSSTPKSTNSRTRKKKVVAAPATPEIIREKAYCIWEGNGYPENNAIDNWLEAEHQLLK